MSQISTVRQSISGCWILPANHWSKTSCASCTSCYLLLCLT